MPAQLPTWSSTPSRKPVWSPGLFVLIVPRNGPVLAVPTVNLGSSSHMSTYSRFNIFYSNCGGTVAQPGMCVDILLSERTVVDGIGPRETDTGSSASAWDHAVSPHGTSPLKSGIRCQWCWVGYYCRQFCNGRIKRSLLMPEYTPGTATIWGVLSMIESCTLLTSSGVALLACNWGDWLLSPSRGCLLLYKHKNHNSLPDGGRYQLLDRCTFNQLWDEPLEHTPFPDSYWTSLNSPTTDLLGCSL